MKPLYIILLLVANLAYSQTYRFIYQLQIKQEDFNKTHLMALDVDKDWTKFYDHKFLDTDSINSANKFQNHHFRINSETEQVLIRPKNSFENKNFYTNTNGDYFFVKSIDEMKWNLHNETKDLNGYKVQKATTKFGGRQWTAWFDPEHSLHEGPYKFRGLPGLIFEIYDDEQIFHYKLVKNKNLPTTYDTSDFVETYYGKKPIEITHLKLVKIKLEDYENPLKMVEELLKKGTKVKMNDEEVTSPAQLHNRRKTIQEAIKKRHIPIEKDKAIPYK